MRYFILAFSILSISCGSGTNNFIEDSVVSQGQDLSWNDSAKYANEHQDELLWEKFDSLPGDSIELMRKDGGGNNYCVELWYFLRGDKRRILLTDNLAAYRHDVDTKHLQLVQLNNTGGKEVVVVIGGYYSSLSGGEYTSWAEEEYYHYVVDLDSCKLLWQGIQSSEYVQYCGEKSDSACEEIETGYNYKVHFESRGILIDSLEFLGDTSESDLDHLPGRYQWKSGKFVLIPE